MWKQITWTSKQTSKKLRSCWCVRRNHVPNTACFPASFVFSLLRGRKWHFASLILKRAFCLIGGAKESVDVEQKKKAIVCHADEIKPEIYFWKQTQKTFCNTENTQAKIWHGLSPSCSCRKLGAGASKRVLQVSDAMGSNPESIIEVTCPCGTGRQMVCCVNSTASYFVLHSKHITSTWLENKETGEKHSRYWYVKWADSSLRWMLFQLSILPDFIC